MFFSFSFWCPSFKGPTDDLPSLDPPAPLREPPCECQASTDPCHSRDSQLPMTQSSLTPCLLPSLALMNDRKSLLSPAARPVCTQYLLLAIYLYTVFTSRNPRSMTSTTPPAPCSHVAEEEFGVNTQVGCIPAHTQPTAV